MSRTNTWSGCHVCGDVMHGQGFGESGKKNTTGEDEGQLEQKESNYNTRHSVDNEEFQKQEKQEEE